MFFLDCMVVEEHGCELFCNSLYGFPVSWAEVGFEREATLQEKNGVNDKGKGPHNIGLMFKLLEA